MLIILPHIWQLSIITIPKLFWRVVALTIAWANISHKVMNKLAQNKLGKDPQSVLLVGATFKENCSDVRNSRCEDIARFLKSNSIVVSVYDPSKSLISRVGV